MDLSSRLLDVRISNSGGRSVKNCKIENYQHIAFQIDEAIQTVWDKTEKQL